MKQASELTKGQRQMLDWIGRRGPVLQMTIIRNDQARTMNALLQAGYIEACDHPATHPQSEKPWPRPAYHREGARGPIDQPTPRTTLAAHHVVTAGCVHCGHVSELDLPELIAAGHGDTPLLELPLRCARCGERRFQLTVARAARP